MATTLNVIKTITIRATAEGMAEVEKRLAAMTSEIEGVTAASGQQERATLSVERAYQKLQTRYDQEFRAQQQLAQVQKVLQQAQEQGIASQQRASELMQQALVFYNRSAPAAAAYAKSLNEVASGMSAVGKAALESSQATQRLTAGMSAAGQQAAAPRPLDVVARGMTEATNASKNMIDGM